MKRKGQVSSTYVERSAGEANTFWNKTVVTYGAFVLGLLLATAMVMESQNRASDPGPRGGTVGLWPGVGYVSNSWGLRFFR